MDIDIEAQNKIRVAMGMKPLPVPGASSGPVFKASKANDASDEDPASTLESRQAQGYDNWKKLQDEAEAKAKREARKEEIRKARDAAARFAKIEGKSLGEVDEGAELDTKSWLLQQKKRQKKIDKARRLEQELAEREQEALRQAQYTAADLAGVKVGHELSGFDEGAEQVLTLKDAAVDAEDEDDELENIDLRERERLDERLESKKRKPVYNPNDMDERGQQSLLAQYDETIDGKKSKRFTLDGQGNVADLDLTNHGDAVQRKGVQISLDILKDDTPISDYVDPKEIKTRKPKKKKGKSTRRRAADDDDIFPVPELSAPQDTQLNEVIDVDGAATNGSSDNSRKRPLADTNVVDDDDLQANLAMQRRAALKKRKRMRPEDLARQFREEASATPGIVESTETPEDVGMVIDETSEFVANLRRPGFDNEDEDENEDKNKDNKDKDKQQEKSVQANSDAVPEALAPPSLAPGIKAETDADGDGDAEMGQSYAEVGSRQDDKERARRSVSASADITTTGLEEESTLDQGVGAALSMLRQRNLVKAADADDLNSKWRQRQHFLTEKHKREDDAERKARLQRERDRQSGRLDRMSAREREEYARWNNTQRDQMESRQMADVFNREYKPDVHLKYVDEFGREMNQKEAFKHLSHQFHGKGSGKQKTEKRLKKIDEEKKRMAMSSLDVGESTGMSSAQGDQAKKQRKAGIRLQ